MLANLIEFSTQGDTFSQSAKGGFIDYEMRSGARGDR